MRSDGELTLPAGTASVLVALPGGPLSDSPLARVAAEAAGAHSGVHLAGRPQGDGHVMVFARASDAAACSLAVQRALTANAIPARIAVHTSQAGYPGPGLDRYAALARVAGAGQVLLSQASAGVAAEGLPADADLADLGWHRLADLGPAEHVWQLRHPDLPGTFPPLRSLSTYRHNLPVELNSFVPRDAELAELTALIAEARLVTLTGSGGCGKTRLALHAAAGRVGAHAEETDGLLRACPQLCILATSREPLGVPGEVTWRVPSLPFPAKCSARGTDPLRGSPAVRRTRPPGPPAVQRQRSARGTMLAWHGFRSANRCDVRCESTATAWISQPGCGSVSAWWCRSRSGWVPGTVLTDWSPVWGP
jgi:hypothetical protein